MYLNTHSYFSFKYGTISVKHLLTEMQLAGVDQFALTDINNTAASINFVRLAPKYGVKPVLGIDFRNGADQLFIAIAKNNEGFKELNDYLSLYLHSRDKIPSRPPQFSNAYVVYPYSKYNDFELKHNEFIGIKHSELPKLVYPGCRVSKDKIVALETVTFRSIINKKTGKREVLKRDFNAHRLLRAIDNNCLLSKLPKSEEANSGHFLYPLAELKTHYKSHPYILVNTKELLANCHIRFDFTGENLNKNKRAYSVNLQKDYELLQELCERNLLYRYPNPSQKILDRIENELSIIKQQGFMSYFLINWDICKYARSKGYFYVGRGSGANSIVAYLLNITDVDPIELDLYFERFINLYRQNPPDFDIDFSWRDREDITHYIFERFDHVALLATYSTFQFRAVIRELGKVLGLPPHEIDCIQAARVEELEGIHKSVLHYAKYIEGFPSHLSIHAGGILISEKPIHYYTATNLPPKGFQTVQFDMVTAEDIGLYKFDILSQRGLGKIKDCLEVIEKNHPDHAEIDIHDIAKFKQDPAVKKILREGKTIGCFYVESPAMRMLLKKLRVEEYLGLVAASSVIRPGVAKSGMMRQYILRFREPERRNEAHPVLLDIMPETYGVMVYQEDVIKVAHIFAGLNLAEADVLRRGMSGKYRSREEFQKVREKYFKNCRERAVDYEMAADIWRQIESFAGYAFAKGHSASYAVESYQSLFLKAHYPLEYMVATLNNGGGFYRMELYVHEARMQGGEVRPPCINESDALTTIYGNAIYLGLTTIGDLEEKIIEKVIREREQGGAYTSFNNFINRVQISLEQLTLLIRAGAFRSISKLKKELLWEAHLKIGGLKRNSPQKVLFDCEFKEVSLPELSYHGMEDAFDEMDLLGFPLCSPFDLLSDKYETEILVTEMFKYKDKEVDMLGYLVHIKNTSTSGGKNMQFGTFIDREGEFIDTTHFPNVAENHPFRGRGIYLLKGKVVEEFDFYSLEVSAMKKLSYIPDPRFTSGSRHATMAVSGLT